MRKLRLRKLDDAPGAPRDEVTVFADADGSVSSVDYLGNVTALGGSQSVWLTKTFTTADILAAWDVENNIVILPIFELALDDAIVATAAWHTIADAGKVPTGVDFYMTSATPNLEELIPLTSFNGPVFDGVADDPVQPIVRRYNNDGPTLVLAETPWVTAYMTNQDNAPPEAGTLTFSCEVIRASA